LLKIIVKIETFHIYSFQWIRLNVPMMKVFL